MIICAAVKFHIEQTNSNVIIPCLRHHYAFEIIRDLGFNPRSGYTVLEDGFITDKNEFLNRKDAYNHAEKCGQLSATVRQNNDDGMLFSEDLY